MAWEQAISEAWDNIIEHTKAVPSEKDKPDDGDENSEDNNQFAGKSYEGTRNPDSDFINKHGESTLEEHALDMT